MTAFEIGIAVDIMQPDDNNLDKQEIEKHSSFLSYNFCILTAKRNVKNSTFDIQWNPLARTSLPGGHFYSDTKRQSQDLSFNLKPP
jgi:hypothetical protein